MNKLDWGGTGYGWDGISTPNILNKKQSRTVTPRPYTHWRPAFALNFSVLDAIQIEEGKRNLYSGLSLNFIGHPHNF